MHTKKRGIIMIYFDYTATTPVDKDVFATYQKAQEMFYANTQSIHTLGKTASRMVDKAIYEIKTLFSVPNHRVIFTSNATEANNLGIFGIVLKEKKGRIITTTIEHPSVYEVMKHLETKGYEVIYLAVDSNGQINLDELKQAMNSNTILVSIMWVNNVIGAIQPIKEVISIVKQHPKAKLHVDMVQGIGKIEPSFSYCDVDLFTMSGHKLYAPKGVGLLVYHDNIQLRPILFGSKAQAGIKPGTMDVGLCVAITKALKKYLPLVRKHNTYIMEWNAQIIASVQKNPSIYLNSPKNKSPYIISIAVPNKTGETLVRMMEDKGVYVSTGSACGSKLQKSDRTILAITGDEKRATSSIRISLSHLHRLEDIHTLCNILEEL